METGSISKWNLSPGDKFDVGTVICEVETDKASVSYEATDSGYLAKILVQAGEIKVGELSYVDGPVPYIRHARIIVVCDP